MAGTILYVDDDADDIEFLSLEIQRQRPDTNVIGAANGQEALIYMEDAKAGLCKMPCLIVLDLNMPVLNGRQTFDALKNDPALKNVPIAILTTTQNPNEKNYFNSNGIEFFIKPDNISYLSGIAKNLLLF